MLGTYEELSLFPFPSADPTKVPFPPAPLLILALTLLNPIVELVDSAVIVNTPVLLPATSEEEEGFGRVEIAREEVERIIDEEEAEEDGLEVVVIVVAGGMEVDVAIAGGVVDVVGVRVEEDAGA